MRKIITFLLALFVSVNTFGQSPYPNCNDLTVEAINIDTAGDLSITIRNTCYSCSLGITGCVYSEMKVVRIVAPFDTIAASNCYCLHWEDPDVNGELQTFTLNTDIVSLPPVSDLQVRMTGCGCDTIPFSQILLNIAPGSVENSYSIFPNPAKDEVNIVNLPKGSILHITDITGKIFYMTVITDREQTVINTANFVNGIYIVHIENNGTITNRKLVISK